MPLRDDNRLFAQLAAEHAARSPRSAALHEQAQRVMVDGGSHALRLMEPFPARITRASGAWLEDEDGHAILDYWQGHMGNILGHNPPVITQALAEAFAQGMGLTTGMTSRLQVEVAELFCGLTGLEKVRFTTSGALATMYALMLARAFTGRSLVMKVGGGWHGAQPWGLHGVSFRDGYKGQESDGLPASAAADIIITGFNQPERLAEQFKLHGEQVSCLIVEPFLGAGGSIPASPEYLREARRLTEQYGALLVMDEVISGFRFRAGGMFSLYGIQPDLAVFGKIIGGGMPVAAVAGRGDILALAGRSAGNRVKFSGGTYSAHPASLLASKTMLSYLKTHEDEIYPAIASLGGKTRQVIETAFASEGVLVSCTGHHPDVLPGSSIFGLHFPRQPGLVLDRPEVVNDPALCDVSLATRVLDLALLLEDVYAPHAHGAVSYAHRAEDLPFLDQACRAAARRISQAA